jgi:hypothetical protein
VTGGDTTRVEFRLETEATCSAPCVPSAARRARRVRVAASVGHGADHGARGAGRPEVRPSRTSFRVVQLLPGVEARNDFSTGLNVRGGESDQNLILIDGYPIYNPFHLGGLFSTFIDPTVRDVTLMTGGFPRGTAGASRRCSTCIRPKR